MIERGEVKFNIQRGATVAEFTSFLNDFEIAYAALYHLPTRSDFRSLRRLERFMPFEFWPLEMMGGSRNWVGEGRDAVTFPPDQLEIIRISIQSPGWVEMLGALNPLQQIREYLKDRHERRKDEDWRSASERDRAHAELRLLEVQIEREQAGALKDYIDILDGIGLSRDEKLEHLWTRVGQPLAQLGRHQDSGLLGTQNSNLDGRDSTE